MTASKGRRVVVVGTGTDVGKTHVTTALLAAARARGLSVAAYKPVATGVAESCEDAVRHAEALGAAYVPPTFAYARPVSPHLAAREEGRPVSLDAVAARSAELGAGRDLLVVEGAGGLFSPLGPSITNVDLARAVEPDVVVLVAVDRLGVLHDVAASRAGARARGMRSPVVVLSAPASADASTGSNAAELEVLGLGPVIACFPRCAPFEAAAERPASALLDAVLARASARRP